MLYFGETSYGEKDVANKLTEESCYVKLDFEIDKDNYVLIRDVSSGKSSVKLYKNDQEVSARNKTDTNKQIVNLLGIDKNIFLDSVFLSQSVNTNLTGLSPTSRKERLELLTNTNIIIEQFKSQIKDKQIKYETECTDCQININKLEGNSEIIVSQLNSCKNQIRSLENELENLLKNSNIEEIKNNINGNFVRITMLNEDIESNLTKIKEYKEELEQKEAHLKSKVEELKSLRMEKENNVDSYNNINNQISLSDKEINYINREIVQQQNEIENIKLSDTCPTCGRKYENVNENHIKELIETKKQEIESKQAKIKEIESNQQTLNQELKEIEIKIKSQKENEEKLEIKQNQLNTIIQETNNNINKIRDIIDDNLKQIQALKSENETLNYEINKIENNNIKEKIEEQEKLINNFEQQLLEINEKMDKLREDYTKHNDMVNVAKHILQLITKDFRTFLLKNSINFINTLLQKYSHKLFSNEKDVIYLDDDSNKLDIKLGNQNYESLSGGEKTRVDVALLLAQKLLANTLGDISSNIIILDEILKFCDSNTEEVLIDLIISELDDLESIFMINHKEIPIGYDTQWIVKKNKDGFSSLI